MRQYLCSIIVGAALFVPSFAAAQRQAIVPPGTTPSHNYSPGVRFGNMLFAAGQTGNARTAQTSPIEVQTQEALDHLKSVLEAGGTTLENVVSCTVYLIDLKDFAGMNSVYTKVFSHDPPARATVAVAMLVTPGAKIEIQCVAGIPG